MSDKPTEVFDSPDEESSRSSSPSDDSTEIVGSPEDEPSRPPSPSGDSTEIFDSPEDGSSRPSSPANDSTEVIGATEMDSPGPIAPTGELPKPAEQIGPYHLLEIIGEGGMGSVYLAEQTEPIRRRVALKIIKQGMDTREVIARFESERQVLAMMDHPCIAKVLDAGATPRGRPFFVMEHVDGVPITHHCDENRMNVRQRLELFMRVCEGIQHAHQKAIIHRDIKPSNVMVTIQDGEAVPKIIDFGIAKATSSDVDVDTGYTQIGQMIGTPEYMSPEQAEMGIHDIDTRTDVYSLGMLLYELLAGALPFDSSELRRSSIDEMRRRIREEEPTRPSSRLNTLSDTIDGVAQARRTNSAKLRGMLKEDLDWIILKALEKDQERRYETANALALDIRRHLDDQPVRAGPPRTSYRIKKFVRRHRTAVAVSGMLAAVIVLGIFGTTTGLVRALRAEKEASTEAETARQVSDFLVGLFEVSDPNESRGSTITAREILDRGASRIEDELGDRPRTQAHLMATIGRVYQNLGLLEQASDHLEHALTIRRAQLTADDPELAGNLTDLAHLYIDQGRYEEAEPLLRESLRSLESELGPDDLDLAPTLTNLASINRRQGHFGVAEPLYRRALTIREAGLGPEHPEVGRSLNSLAILNWQQGNYAAAESLYLRALAIWQGSLGLDHADVAKGMNNLALLYHEQKKYDLAIPLFKEAGQIYEKVLGPEHYRLALALNNLALVYLDQERLAEAQPLLERALVIGEKALGPDHPEVARTMNNLANLNRDREQFAAAEPLYERALAIREAALGADHADVAWSLRDLGLSYQRQGRLGEADAALLRSQTILEAALGPDHPELADILEDRATLLRVLGRSREAAELDEWAARNQFPNDEDDEP